MAKRKETFQEFEFGGRGEKSGLGQFASRQGTVNGNALMRSGCHTPGGSPNDPGTYATRVYPFSAARAEVSLPLLD